MGNCYCHWEGRQPLVALSRNTYVSWRGLTDYFRVWPDRSRALLPTSCHSPPCVSELTWALWTPRPGSNRVYNRAPGVTVSGT